jgi:seryl-tRNA synthetase
VPLTNLVRESILDESTRTADAHDGLTPCFRSEAGAAGAIRAA